MILSRILQDARAPIFKCCVTYVCPNDCGGKDEDEWSYVAFCPKCDKELHHIDGQNYCPYCGQKIWWDVKYPSITEVDEW